MGRAARKGKSVDSHTVQPLCTIPKFQYLTRATRDCCRRPTISLMISGGSPSHLSYYRLRLSPGVGYKYLLLPHLGTIPSPETLETLAENNSKPSDHLITSHHSTSKDESHHGNRKNTHLPSDSIGQLLNRLDVSRPTDLNLTASDRIQQWQLFQIMSGSLDWVSWDTRWRRTWLPNSPAPRSSTYTISLPKH